MGTRALVRFHDDEGVELATVYRQFDGYPSGLGADLKAILADRVLVNGFNDASRQLNGMQCLAAFVVSGLKDGCGGVYLYRVGSADCGEEYEYVLKRGAETVAGLKKGWQIDVEVYSCYRDKRRLYQGPIADFDPERAEGDL